MDDVKNVNVKIRELQTDLIALRESFIYLANRKYKRKMQQKLDILDKYECEEENFECPDFSIDVKEPEATETAKSKNIIKKSIKLLQILSYKADCPISQIIDNI